MAAAPVLTPDGKRLYVCNRFDNKIAAIDLHNGKRDHHVLAPREPCSAAVTPDGKSLFAADLLPHDPADAGDVAADHRRRYSHEPPDRHSPAQRQHRRTWAVRFARRPIRLRRPHSRPLPTAHHASGSRLGEHERFERHRRAGEETLNTVLFDDVFRGAANPWGVAATADGKRFCVTHAGTHELSVIDVPGLMAKLAKASAIITLGPATDTASTNAETMFSPAANVCDDLAFLGDLRQPRTTRRKRPTRRGDYRRQRLRCRVFLRHPCRGRFAIEAARARRPIARPQADDQRQTPRRNALQRRDDLLPALAKLELPSRRADGRAVLGLAERRAGQSEESPVVGRGLEAAPRWRWACGIRRRTPCGPGSAISSWPSAAETDAQAIDEYLRSLKPAPSPRLMDGRLSPAAERGEKIFFDRGIGCTRCHPAPQFTDKRAHNVGMAGPFDDPGDHFQTPSLVELCAPPPTCTTAIVARSRRFSPKASTAHCTAISAASPDGDIDDLVEFLLSL